jgi:CRISPR/Cas system-associated exonuclease Cas4 (RecB family)
MVAGGRSAEERALGERDAFNDLVPGWYKTFHGESGGERGGQRGGGQQGGQAKAGVPGDSTACWSEEVVVDKWEVPTDKWAVPTDKWAVPSPPGIKDSGAIGGSDNGAAFEDGVVVEYKSHTKLTPASLAKSTAKLQMQLYSLAYQRTFGVRPKEVRLEIIETGKTYSFRGDDESDAEALAQVKAAAEGVSAGLFPPTPSFMGCKFCSYNDICPAGR